VFIEAKDDGSGGNNSNHHHQQTNTQFFTGQITQPHCIRNSPSRHFR